MIETPWLNKEQAAEYTGVDIRTIERWVVRGYLTKYHPGDLKRSPRYKRADLDALMTPVPRRA